MTAPRGRIEPGAEIVGADEWAEKLGTINYEIVAGISRHVPRTAAGSG